VGIEVAVDPGVNGIASPVHRGFSLLRARPTGVERGNRLI
jgi:hypothetical protein